MSTITLPSVGNTQSINYDWCVAKIQGSNGAVLYNPDNRIASVTRTQAGRYNIVFTTPHPNGDEYTITDSVEEDVPNLDGRISQIQAGSQTANGFTFLILTGDNGTAADGTVDENFHIAVKHTITVVVP